jgi:hypothetical protein
LTALELEPKLDPTVTMLPNARSSFPRRTPPLSHRTLSRYCETVPLKIVSSLIGKRTFQRSQASGSISSKTTANCAVIFSSPSLPMTPALDYLCTGSSIPALGQLTRAVSGIRYFAFRLLPPVPCHNPTLPFHIHMALNGIDAIAKRHKALTYEP